MGHRKISAHLRVREPGDELPGPLRGSWSLARAVSRKPDARPASETHARGGLELVAKRRRGRDERAELRARRRVAQHERTWDARARVNRIGAAQSVAEMRARAKLTVRKCRAEQL